MFSINEKFTNSPSPEINNLNRQKENLDKEILLINENILKNIDKMKENDDIITSNETKKILIEEEILSIANSISYLDNDNYRDEINYYNTNVDTVESELNSINDRKLNKIKQLDDILNEDISYLQNQYSSISNSNNTLKSTLYSTNDEVHLKYSNLEFLKDQIQELDRILIDLIDIDTELNKILENKNNIIPNINNIIEEKKVLVKEYEKNKKIKEDNMEKLQKVIDFKDKTIKKYNEYLDDNLDTINENREIIDKYNEIIDGLIKAKKIQLEITQKDSNSGIIYRNQQNDVEAKMLINSDNVFQIYKDNGIRINHEGETTFDKKLTFNNSDTSGSFLSDNDDNNVDIRNKVSSENLGITFKSNGDLSIDEGLCFKHDDGSNVCTSANELEMNFKFLKSSAQNEIQHIPSELLENPLPSNVFDCTNEQLEQVVLPLIYRNFEDLVTAEGIDGLGEQEI